MKPVNKPSSPKSRSLGKKDISGNQKTNTNDNEKDKGKDNDDEDDINDIVAFSGKQILVQTNPVTFPSAAYAAYDDYGRPVQLNNVPNLFSQYRTNRVIIQPRPLRFKRYQPIRPTKSDTSEPVTPRTMEQPVTDNDTTLKKSKETVSGENTSIYDGKKFDVTQPSQTHFETPRSKIQKSLLSTLPKTSSAINDALDEEKDAYHERLVRVMNDKGPADIVYNPRKMSPRNSNSASRKSNREVPTKMVPGEVQNNGIGLIITPFVHQAKRSFAKTANQLPKAT